jgi:hypothetical protein
MNDVFKLVQQNSHVYHVVYKNNRKYVGSFERDVDGYFYYWMPQLLPTQGFIPACHLKLLADMLDELNEPWDKIVEQTLSRGCHIPEVSF